jgi:hypothetical protein
MLVQRTVIDNSAQDSPSTNEDTTGYNTSPKPNQTKMSPTTINENGDRTIETNNNFLPYSCYKFITRVCVFIIGGVIGWFIF